MYRRSQYTFDQLVELAGWTPEDGPVKGAWYKRTPGERLLWTCTWIADDGAVDPAIIAPNDPVSMKLELSELADRGDRWAVQLLRDGYEGNEQAWKVHLAEARRHYAGEYAFPGCARAPELMWPRFRDGWPRPAWAALA